MGEPMRKRDEMEKGDYLKPNDGGLGALIGSLLGMVRGSRKPSTGEMADAKTGSDDKALLWLQDVEAGKVNPGDISPAAYKKYKRSLINMGYDESAISDSITRGRIKAGTFFGPEADYFIEMDKLKEELVNAPSLAEKAAVREKMEEFQVRSRKAK